VNPIISSPRLPNEHVSGEIVIADSQADRTQISSTYSLHAHGQVEISMPNCRLVSEQIDGRRIRRIEEVAY
jgi:hypothetical protein